MKFSEAWLREWVNPALTSDALCEKLTMSGLEVEELAPVAGVFKGVVIGEIVEKQKHPEADKLSVCIVKLGITPSQYLNLFQSLNSGNEDKFKTKSYDDNLVKLQIVCGAANAAVGIRIPVALIGAQLPNGLTIKEAKLRGVTSEGMLCSASELGLSDDQPGLMILPADAPLGVDIRKYLELDDHTIDLSITPNRGDCLSIKGIAREVSALTDAKVTAFKIENIKPKVKD